MYTFLFNADDLSFSDWYRRDIENIIWKCNVLQKVKNSLVVYQGDLLAIQQVQSVKELETVAYEIIRGIEKEKKAIYLLKYGNIFLWSVEDLRREDAEKLNESLAQVGGYLGYKQVNKANQWQNLYYVDLLIKTYIIGDYNIQLCIDGCCEDDFTEELTYLRKQGFKKAELRREFYGY